jgi:hypothetical protein
MRVEHDFGLLFGPGRFARENTIDLQCRRSPKCNASYWDFWPKRRDARTIGNNRGAMENTMESNEAIIALLTSGCKGATDWAALGAWLTRAHASNETHCASRAGREAQFENSHLCH